MKTILLLILVLLSACVQEIPINPPKSSHHLVITGLISPKKAISLTISDLMAFTDTIIAKSPKILEISILQDNVLIGIPTGSGPDICTSVYPNEGSEYTLIVRTESDTLAAGTTVPTEILLLKADYWFSKIPSQNFDTPVEASITWEDPAGIENYYELQILDANMKALSFYQFDQIDDPVIQQESDLDYAPSSFVFTDRQFDGKPYTLGLRFQIGRYPTRPDSAYVVLRNLSEEYYHFKKSWHKHIFLQNTAIQWDGDLSFSMVYSLLFQGDPIPLYTNVQNGLGIFAGYSQDIRKFRFKE